LTTDAQETHTPTVAVAISVFQLQTVS